jgi:hypothetical protein
MFNLSNYQLLPIFLVSIVVILAASEVGRWLGVRTGRSEASILTVEGAVLGLLALMIGFTFAMALARFEDRRAAIVLDANSIGTAALRARLLPAPHNKESLRLLKDYVQIRLDVSQHAPSPAEISAALTRSNAVQEALWQQAKAVAATDNRMVPTGLFIQSLNEMIDNQEKRVTAIRQRVPNVVFLTLYGTAAIAGAFAGYASGLGQRSSRLPVYVMIALVCGVIIMIQNLDRPLVGFIAASQQPMIDTAATINAYSD